MCIPLGNKRIMIAYASYQKDKLYVLVSSRFNELDVKMLGHIIVE